MDKLAFIVSMYAIMFGIALIAAKCKLKKMAKKDKKRKKDSE